MSEIPPPAPRSPRSSYQERQVYDLFGDAASQRFDPRSGGFVPLPILLRRLLRHLSLAELRVLVYLYLRANRYGFCYPPVSEIAAELGVSQKHLPTRLRSLEARGFIKTREKDGRVYFLILDPEVAVRSLISSGVMDERELADINNLRELLRHAPIAIADLASASATAADFDPSRQQAVDVDEDNEDAF